MTGAEKTRNSDLFPGGHRDNGRAPDPASGIASLGTVGGRLITGTSRTPRKRRLSAALLSAVAISGAADETNAHNLLQAMSDFLAAQASLTVDYDAMWEIATTADQKLGLASSGTVALVRPDEIRATRSNGIEELQMVFDGKTFTLRVEAKAAVLGTLDAGDVSAARRASALGLCLRTLQRRRPPKAQAIPPCWRKCDARSPCRETLADLWANLGYANQSVLTRAVCR